MDYNDFHTKMNFNQFILIHIKLIVHMNFIHFVIWVCIDKDSWIMRKASAPGHITPLMGRRIATFSKFSFKLQLLLIYITC